MANKRNSKQKQPGEKSRYHYNPGNQSGKTVEIIKPESAQENSADRIQSRHEQRNQKRK